MSAESEVANDDDVKFSEQAPTAPSTDADAAAKAPSPASNDDDLLFTDEVGSKNAAPAPKPVATPAPAPAAASPPKPMAPSGPPAGSTTSSRTRIPAAGSAPGTITRTSSDRMRALSSSGAGGALEPARGKRSPASSSFPTEGPGERTSDRLARARKEEVYDAVKPGLALGEFTVGEKLPDLAPAVSGRYSDDEPLRAFKVERKGRESFLLELAIHSAAAQDVVSRADRLIQVRHDELEAILSAGRSRDGAWLIVDPRPTLRQQVKEKGPLAEKDALAAIRSAARALAALRQRGLNHGDPSPRHLLADANGTVKLATPARVRPMRAAFQAGPVIGDPRYAAPEVLDGQEPSSASDVYTLGLALLFLVTGKDPIPTEEPYQAFFLRTRIAGRTPEVAVVAPSLSPGAKGLVERMLAVDPAQRYEPTELVAEIEAVLMQGKVPGPAPAKTVPSSLPRPLIPVPLAAIVAVAGVALIVGAAVVIGRFQATDPTQGYRFTIPLDGK